MTQKNISHDRVLALLLILGLILVSFDHYSVVHNRGNLVIPVEVTSRASSLSSPSTTLWEPVNEDEGASRINVFYNLYTPNANEVERVKAIVSEQLSFLLPEEHNNVWVTSIGHQLSEIKNATIIQHTSAGDEGLTLHALWDYCRSNPYHETKVIYLHSKGSYHDTPENSKLRSFITRSALSKECANLPDQCNVCSSRMSPLPHPHTSGNMWLARCDYVAKLVDPLFEREGKYEVFSISNSQRGHGRFFFEHWIHLHPTARPCDIYPDPEFTSGYKNIPDGDFEKDLQMAPRFDFLTYNPFDHIPPKHIFVKEVMWEYDILYNLRPDETWWGWEFYDTTYFQLINSD